MATIDITDFATAQAGDTVILPQGTTYIVDVVNAPIRLNSGVTLQIDGTLQALPSNQRISRVILLDGVSDIAIILNGQIIGDADCHQGPASDDGGMGIASLGAINLSITGAGSVSRCQGDGVYVDRATKNVTLRTFTSVANKRQAMSVIDVDGLDADGVKFLNTGGLPPGAGVDFEPDDSSRQSIRNVKMRNCTITGNAGASVLIACPPSARSNIDIDGSNKMDKHPVDGNDGIVPFWAKWYFYVFHSYALYPRSIKL